MESDWISFTIWGIIYQNIPWGVMMPIYYAVHLVISPTAHATHVKSKRQLVQFDNAALCVLPWSVLIGCLVPTALMALPSPQLISHDTHKLFVVIWQPFPLWVGLCQLIFTKGTRQSNIPEKKAVETSQQRIHKICTLCLRFVVLLNTFLWYLITFSDNYSWGSSFGEAGLLQKFIKVFIPVPLADKVTVETLPMGCLALLQYDAYFACGASLIWACVLYRRLVGALTLSNFTGWIARSLLYGPGGAALFVLKSRDDVLFDQTLKED
ncbi:hypothetical protein PISL3812_02661 [Talaromyces islandicus]|uniref:Uncharacterized protein n=1 Tax=Talaromyces islandicus TaxID=28573 RepID=A0A0U1LST4_TALIS|nr:hypothetical protein PISL3812_02661 [Talaromyces islandicus]